jgi:hypothetical protein
MTFREKCGPITGFDIVPLAKNNPYDHTHPSEPLGHFFLQYHVYPNHDSLAHTLFELSKWNYVPIFTCVFVVMS